MSAGVVSGIDGEDVGGSSVPTEVPETAPQAGSGSGVPEPRAVGAPLAAGPADRWGLISVPTLAPPGGEAQGDPCLWIYLQFLKAFLQTDARVKTLWNAAGMAPGTVVVNAIRAHGPGDDESEPFGLGLTTKDLPALYMWRRGGSESSSLEYEAEDWLVETCDVRLLWVFPDAVQGIQRGRQTFVNAMAKAIVVAIERGRTPSFVVPGDPDPQAALNGSYVHTFTEVMAINALRWGPAKVRITTVGDRGDAASVVLKSALEMRFELKENLVMDPNMWSFPAALRQTVTQGNPMQPSWAAVTLFAAGAYVLAGPPGAGLYVYRAGSKGFSGYNPPEWPTTTGATVVDGSITWTCVGAAPPPASLVGQG